VPLIALVLIFIVLPITELYVIYLVGDAIGILPTLGLLAADSVLGSLLLKSQGRAAWRRFNEALAEGRMPHREVQDGVAVIFGGAFLITPGFLTDVLGVLLLLPPTRAVIRRLGVRALSRRVVTSAAGGAAERSRARSRGRRFDVEGTASEYSPPDRPNDSRRLER
jgi:UPF0716 protein FxsA